MDLFREKHAPQAVWAISENENPQNMAWLDLLDWIILEANEWEDYSNSFGEGAGISRN